MKKSETFAVRVATAVAKFRILRDWNITTSETFDGRAQSDLVSFGEPSLGDDLRRANVFPWGSRGEDEPADYVLHSVIHIAFRALELHKAVNPNDTDDIEARLIQNLCTLILKE